MGLGMRKSDFRLGKLKWDFEIGKMVIEDRVRADSGEVRVAGTLLPSNPGDVIRAGVSTIGADLATASVKVSATVSSCRGRSEGTSA